MKMLTCDCCLRLRDDCVQGVDGDGFDYVLCAECAAALAASQHTEATQQDRGDV